MEQPLVSIIIPAYNASRYLAEAINSALAQTYDNVEIIVVNDGSQDDGATREVALSYGNKIRYYEKENGGCASALNYGIDVMRGEWFSWLSHDDLYLPKKIQTMLEKLALYAQANKKPETVIVCDTILVNEKNEEVPCPFKQTIGMLTPKKAFAETLIKKTFNGCGMLISKNTIDEVGYFITDYRHQLDREYWMRIALHGHSFLVIDEKLVKSRVHNAQITVQESSLLFEEEIKLINNYFELIKNNTAMIIYANSLMLFSYKRKHYAEGDNIKKLLILNHQLSLYNKFQCIYYTLYGITRVWIGNRYRKFIRK